MRRRSLNRKRKQNPIRCGHDPAGLRSALCRDSVRNGYALSRCVAPRCRKPTHEPPICARSVPKAALARPLPTCYTRQKGRLNFLYPNLMVQDPGAYRFGDYWKLGLVCMALYFIIATVLVPIVWLF